MAAVTQLTLAARTVSRTIVEAQPIAQGADESVVYGVTTTAWGTPTIPVVAKIYRITGGTHVDVTATCMTGDASVLANVISVPLIHSLGKDQQYRVDVTFFCEPSTFEFYFLLSGEL